VGIATAILIGTVALATLSLLAYLSHAAIAGRIGEGNAKADAAELRGKLGIAGKSIEEANTATKQAVEAEHAQEERGNSLEKDLVDEERRPGAGGGLGGLAGLSSLSEAEPLPRRDP
jgi:hypothetical protein